MKREINYKEHTTEAAALIAFARYLNRDTSAAKVATAQMFKQVCRLRLIDYKKIGKTDFDEFSSMNERDGLYAHKLYQEIISLREIPISLHQPKERFLAQAERIFSAILDYANIEIPTESIRDIRLVLAKLHYSVEKAKEDEDRASSLTKLY